MNAYYAASVDKFLLDSEHEILGTLAANNQHALEDMQRLAWLEQIRLLKRVLADGTVGWIGFELQIPRMGKRADAVLVVDEAVIVLEFKVKAEQHSSTALAQVEDYALDLKNFHEGSHNVAIVPVLVSTNTVTRPWSIEFAPDQVAKPLAVNEASLADCIKSIRAYQKSAKVCIETWKSAGYRPTPTIIEAAQMLYNTHSVEAISRSDAGATNLRETSQAILEVIRQSRAEKRKAICFVTGVPGSGKTLAGLNIATLRSETDPSENAVFLSGNGPLVDVLREALTRDRVRQAGVKRDAAYREVSSFIQNIHHFRSEYIFDSSAPSDRVVVFDEAQRAWNEREVSKFMLRKKGIVHFGMSEPEFLLRTMDRHEDWCAVICLIGGGQEINTGEAGISEWIEALEAKLPDWKVYVSPRIVLPEYGAPEQLHLFVRSARVQQDVRLHLATSMRSFRAEHLADFIDCILLGDVERARELASDLLLVYPMVLTRDLQAARQWLKIRERGTERVGLVAHSGALRLRPEGIHVKADVDPANWFLNPSADVRSSCHLEEVATEFDVQGLELDWVGVCWDGNLSRRAGAWHCEDFKGSRWYSVHSRERERNIKNAYRVLLTRARQGVVIFVPNGNDKDATRLPSRYSGIVEHLCASGIPMLD